MKTKIINIIVLLFIATNVQAQSTWVDQDDDKHRYQSYDSIVNELQRAQSTTRARRGYSSDPFQNVEIHAGMSYVGAFMNFSPVDAPGDYQTVMQGVQFNFGIDLFSPYWAADVAIRSFGDTSMAQQTSNGQRTANASMKEFDLKLLYRPYIGHSFKLKVGGGLAARYLRFAYDKRYKGEVKRAVGKYNSPASIVFFGGDIYFTKAMSLGAELSLRSPLISETVEETSLDGALQVGAHF